MATMDLATTAIPTPTGAVRREKPLLKPMPPLTLTTATTDIATATIPTMATATGEGRREKPLLKPMLPLTLTTATTDIDTATIPTMATATGEGRRGYVLSLSTHF